MALFLIVRWAVRQTPEAAGEDGGIGPRPRAASSAPPAQHACRARRAGARTEMRRLPRLRACARSLRAGRLAPALTAETGRFTAAHGSASMCRIIEVDSNCDWRKDEHRDTDSAWDEQRCTRHVELPNDTRAGAQASGQAAETLTVTDNRTGKTYELPITDGTVRAMDLRQIKTGEDDFGLMAYDPAYMNTASCRSAITYIDGEAGILQHRGYPIEQLCEHSSYLEVAYLLINGALPTQTQLEDWIHEITIHTFVHENVKDFMQGFRYDANPMGMLVASVGALSTFYPDANQIHDEQVRAIQIIRLLAKMPTLAAFAFRHNMGQPYVYPDNDLAYAGNFLGMMYKMTELKYEPDPRLERALDVLFILHADHEQNASTSAVRSVGSTQVDPYSAVAAGVAALYGPLHGGANEAGAADAAQDRAGREHPRLPGGREGRQRAPDGLRPPRLQELRPARADHPQAPRRRVRGARQEPAAGHRHRAREAGARRRLLHLAQALSRTSTSTPGLIYEALGLPVAMFPVMFAIGRTSGWIAQWLEMVEDSEQKIARPRQIYTGERDRDYVPIDQRG